MVRLLRHRQTKGSETARLRLNHRVTPIFRSWAHVSWLSALESVEAIERSSPQTSPLSECLYLNFVTLFLRSVARCRLARQLQSQLLNEQLGVCGRLRVARQN